MGNSQVGSDGVHSHLPSRSHRLRTYQPIVCGATAKKTRTIQVDAFKLICLQNCKIKILAKLLTTRLQAEISKLIDLDQTGFIRGHSIIENFVYAVEQVQKVTWSSRRYKWQAIELETSGLARIFPTAFPYFFTPKSLVTNWMILYFCVHFHKSYKKYLNS